MIREKTSRQALIRAAMTGALVWLLAAPLARAQPITIKIGYVGRAEKKTTISLLDYPPDNDGVAGVRLALDDNNTTGKFLNQRFLLEEARIKSASDPTDVVMQLADRGVSFFIVDLPADMMLKAAEAGRQRNLLFFN